MGGLARAKAPMGDHALHVIRQKTHGHRMDARDGVRGTIWVEGNSGGRSRKAILEEQVLTGCFAFVTLSGNCGNTITLQELPEHTRSDLLSELLLIVKGPRPCATALGVS